MKGIGVNSIGNKIGTNVTAEKLLNRIRNLKPNKSIPKPPKTDEFTKSASAEAAEVLLNRVGTSLKPEKSSPKTDVFIRSKLPNGYEEYSTNFDNLLKKGSQNPNNSLF